MTDKRDDLAKMKRNLKKSAKFVGKAMSDMAAKKPATKRKPAAKKPTIEQLIANGQLIEVPLAETAPAFMFEDESYLNGMDALPDGTQLKYRGKFGGSIVIAEVKKYFAAGYRHNRTSALVAAFAAGGAVVAVVFVTLRHYGVF